MYGKRFFNRRIKYHNDECEIARNLFDVFSPSSVVDFGCGIGSYLSEFKDHGCSVKGFEPHVNTSLPVIPESMRELIFNIDCGAPIKHTAKYDLALCIEVAEHIEESKADNLVNNICNFSDMVFFTAADVGQSGKGHVNCQPQNYWINKFLNNGHRMNLDIYAECDKILSVINSKLSNSLRQNLIIFSK